MFDKGRAPGGRVASRLTEHGSFDHGAQYLTCKTHRFDAEVQRWQLAGAVAPWRGRLVAFDRKRVIEDPLGAERYAGVGGMQGIGRLLAQDLDLVRETRIVALDRRGAAWQVRDEQNKVVALRGFDAVVLAMPSPQAVELLHGHSPIAEIAAGVAWEPCWTAMLAVDKPTGADFEAAFISDDPILGWISRDDRKPQRQAVPGVAERWVLHARARWSRRYLELPPLQAAQWLARSFSARIGHAVSALSLTGHRWRYCAPTRPLPQPFLWDPQQKLGATGDWFDDPRVEGAWLSGTLLAEEILR